MQLIQLHMENFSQFLRDKHLKGKIYVTRVPIQKEGYLCRLF